MTHEAGFARVTLEPERVEEHEVHWSLVQSLFDRPRLQRLQQHYCITKVELVVNPVLRARYKLAVQQQREGDSSATVEHFTFHGTAAAAIEPIVRDGYLVGPCGAVYSTEDPALAVSYSEYRDPRCRQILLNRVCGGQPPAGWHAAGLQIFTVVNPHQILPCYIVHYTELQPTRFVNYAGR